MAGEFCEIKKRFLIYSGDEWIIIKDYVDFFKASVGLKSIYKKRMLIGR